MTDPLAAIASEGAQLEVAAAPEGFLNGAWARLTSPSPRSEIELQGDAFAILLNGAIDARARGAAKESGLGEGVVDCVYALMPAGGGFGGSSPLGRLFRAVVGFFARLKARATPQSEAMVLQ